MGNKMGHRRNQHSSENVRESLQRSLVQVTAERRRSSAANPLFHDDTDNSASTHGSAQVTSTNSNPPRIANTALGGFASFATNAVRQARRRNSGVPNDPNAAFRLACKIGDNDQVHALLQDPKVKPNSEDNYPFRVACEHGHFEIVCLLGSLPEVNPAAGNGYALRKAAENNHVAIVKLLLMLIKGNPHGRMRESPFDTALTIAHKKGHNEIVEALLWDTRANPSKHRNIGIQWTVDNDKQWLLAFLLNDSRVDPGTDHSIALRWSAEQGHLKLVETLLGDRRVHKNALDEQALRMAARNGHAEVVQLLLEHGCSPAACHQACIVESASRGHTSVVQVLLQHPLTDAGARVNQPLREAASRGHIEIVRMLLERPDVDPASVSSDALMSSCYKGHIEVVRALLGHEKVDPAYMESRALVRAAEGGHTDVVRLLLDHPKIDPSSRDSEALGRACATGSLEIVNMLMSASPLVNPAARGQSALDQAVRFNHPEIVERLLLDKRVDPTHANHRAFRLSCERGFLPICEMLIADGRVDVAVSNHSCARLASDNCHPAVLRLLLQHGVDPSRNDSMALRCAAAKGFKECVKILVEDGRSDPRARGHEAIRSAIGYHYESITRMLLGSWEVRKSLFVVPTTIAWDATVRYLTQAQKECWLVWVCWMHFEQPHMPSDMIRTILMEHVDGITRSNEGKCL